MKKYMTLGLVGLLGCSGNGDSGRLEGSGEFFEDDNSEYVIAHLEDGRQGYKIHSDDSVDFVYSNNESWMDGVGYIDRDTLRIDFHDSSVEDYHYLEGSPWVQFYDLDDNVPGNYNYGSVADADCMVDFLKSYDGSFGVVGDSEYFDPYISLEFNTKANDLEELMRVPKTEYTTYFQENCI